METTIACCLGPQRNRGNARVCFARAELALAARRHSQGNELLRDQLHWDRISITLSLAGICKRVAGKCARPALS